MAEVKKKSTAYLQIQSGELLGRIIPLNQPLVQLGKAGNDCAMIAHRIGGYYFSYLEGKNVTLNNFTIESNAVLLKAGDVIRIGTTQFQFYL